MATTQLLRRRQDLPWERLLDPPHASLGSIRIGYVDNEMSDVDK